MNILENNLLQAVGTIKKAILRSQYNVATNANRELLSLYYGVGKYVSEHTRVDAWGTDAINTISSQLQRELPGLRGFSAAAIKKMRLFYEQWCEAINRSLKTNDLKTQSETIGTEILTNRSLAVNDLDWNEFLSLSFTHHYELLAKTTTIEERVFYIHQTVKNKWSKNRMIEEIKADLFHHQAVMPNNFCKTIVSKSSALKAIEMFKDNYLRIKNYEL